MGPIVQFPFPQSLNKREGKLNGLVPGSLFQDDRGRIWVSTLRQLGYVERDRFNPISTIPGGVVLSIAKDRAGNLWVLHLLPSRSATTRYQPLAAFEPDASVGRHDMLRAANSALLCPSAHAR